MSDINTPSTAHMNMAVYWELPNALMGGTLAMRQQKGKYLPKHEGESRKNWNTRLSKATLRNFYRRTVGSLTSKMFPSPIQIEAGLPEPLKTYMNNVDLSGRNINIFAKDLVERGLQEGLTYILTDFNSTAPAASLAEERRSGARPYWMLLPASSVLEVQYSAASGKVEVTYLRFRRSMIEKDANGSEVIVPEVYVITPNTWERWQEIDGKWQIPKDRDDQKYQGVNSLGRVALSVFYTGYVAPFEAVPPLEDLAWMNLEHYQINSDQRNIMTVASFPILACAGYNKENASPPTLGPNHFLFTENVQGKWYYVEHAGAAIDSCRNYIKDLESQMRTYGLQFEIQSDEAETATGRVLDAGEALAPVVAWAMGLEQCLNEALRDMAQWEKMTLSENKVFVKTSVDAANYAKAGKDLDALKFARQNRDISRQAMLSEFKRRGILSDDLDIDEDKKLLDEEGLGMGDEDLALGGDGADAEVKPGQQEEDDPQDPPEE